MGLEDLEIRRRAEITQTKVLSGLEKLRRCVVSQQTVKQQNLENKNREKQLYGYFKRQSAGISH